jgi:hypothetical protein
MPSHPVYDSRHWRDRADEMRKLANSIEDEKTKAMTLGVAEDYDKLAMRADLRSDGKRAR